MSVLTNILNKTIPYTVGGASSTPLNIQLQIDPNFQKTIYKTATILTAGITLGIIAGIVISKRKIK